MAGGKGAELIAEFLIKEKIPYIFAICGDGGFTMLPHVLCTAVEYNIPAIWVVWNNFAWSAIRDIQYGLFDGQENTSSLWINSPKLEKVPQFQTTSHPRCAKQI